jgi:hypothetical protein
MSTIRCSGSARKPPSWWNITDVLAYLDTIELILGYVSKGTKHSLAAALGVTGKEANRRIQFKECKVKGKLVGYRLCVNQPNESALYVLDRLLQALRWRASFYRFDVALDFLTCNDCEARWLKNWLASHVLLRWRRGGPIHDIATTTCWNRQKGRKKRSARDLVAYPTDDPKPNGISGTRAHLELRFQNGAACRKQGIHRPSDLITLDVAALFERHLRLSFVGDEWVRRRVRAAVQADRARHRHHNRQLEAFADRYRADLAGNVEAVYRAAGWDRATFLRDHFPRLRKKSKSYPLSAVFCIPETLTFDPISVTTPTQYPSSRKTPTITTPLSL